MRTIYSSTCPAWHDTSLISKGKWAQINSGVILSGRSDRSVLYSQPNTDSHDTKAMVLGKILQEHCDAPSTEIDVVATTNFDGSEVTLTWTSPGGVYTETAGYIIYRDGIVLVRVPFGTNTYVDTEIEPGQTYTYSVLFHAT